LIDSTAEICLNDMREEPKTPRIAPFLRSLLQILDMEDREVIRWSDDGLAFEIVDIEAMTMNILPKYFRHKKFASFQRQLNYFGFKKVSKTKTDYCTYSRAYFTRDDRSGLIEIRRKTNADKRRPTSISSISSEEREPACGFKRPHIDTNPLSPNVVRYSTRSKLAGSMSPALRLNAKKPTLEPLEVNFDEPLGYACDDLITCSCDLDTSDRLKTEPGEFVNDNEWIEDVEYLIKSPSVRAGQGKIDDYQSKIDDYQSTLCSQMASDEICGRWLFMEDEFDCTSAILSSQCPMVA